MSDDEMIQAITDEIVAIASPIEIILFGSRARHTATPDSDFDFCIIISDELRPLDIKLKLYSHIAKKISCDLLVFRKTDFEMRSKCVGLIQNVIYNEGIKTYAQPAA